MRRLPPPEHDPPRHRGRPHPPRLTPPPIVRRTRSTCRVPRPTPPPTRTRASVAGVRTRGPAPHGGVVSPPPIVRCEYARSRDQARRYYRAAVSSCAIVMSNTGIHTGTRAVTAWMMVKTNATATSKRYALTIIVLPHSSRRIPYNGISLNGTFDSAHVHCHGGAVDANEQSTRSDGNP